MYKKEQIQLFENRNVRTMWDEQEEEWYFSIVDVVAILTDQQDSKKASTYWSVLKGRLRKEGANEPLTKCKKLKMLSADGKAHPTDAATAETLFRIIQSIPSKKAEPFKQWMAQVASDRLDQMQDPELNFEQAYNDYPQRILTRQYDKHGTRPQHLSRSLYCRNLESTKPPRLSSKCRHSTQRWSDSRRSPQEARRADRPYHHFS